MLPELKNSFSLDFLQEGTPDNLYFSHLIIHKLLMFLRKVIFRDLGHTYPSLGEIFDSYSNVLCVMELTKSKPSSAKTYNSEWGSTNGLVVIPVNQSTVISKKPANFENFNIVSKQDKFRCSFCRNNAHSTITVKNTPR